MQSIRIALAQINATVGDLERNKRQIIEGIERAKGCAVDLVVFPELAVTGYPPEDLLLKPSFVLGSRAAIDEIRATTDGITAVVGFVDVDSDIYNAAAVLHDGALAGVYRKHYLPTYGVFDEDRYFRAGTTNDLFVWQDIAIGVSICEDIWYPEGPPQVQARGGAQILVNLSASPYHMGKAATRERMLATRAADNVAIVAFCNLVGGQDELVFDGGSVVFDERGELIARAAQFEEDFLIVDVEVSSVFRWRLHDPRWRKQPAPNVRYISLAPFAQKNRTSSTATEVAPKGKKAAIRPPLSLTEEIYRALVLGTRDYVRKNGFQKVVVGLSGGIDSSLVACIAADALGPENVTGVAMPSRYNAEISQADAAQLARNLGIHFMTLPIEPIFQSYLDILSEPFSGYQSDVTEENLQARIRGNLLMALSNKFGWLVLTTGNKSEMSVGYATLYGDMAGGFAVIKDVPKTLVYELARWRNAQPGGPVIPERVLTRAPSAELRPNQKDTDSLPPYEVLDPILRAYVEEDLSPAEIVAQGFDRATVEQVCRMVDVSEYKRRQAPPGVKITPRALGRDRRLPITNRFRS